MTTAAKVGDALVDYFLRTGSYENLAQTTGNEIVPASTTRAFAPSSFTPFAGLQVRAVGVAEGDVPTCYVYVTRSSRKAEKEIPESIGDVKIRMKKVGRLIVRPEIASASSNHGLAWRRNGRITCGSSIAPAGAHLSGTLGALLKDKKGDLFALSNNHVIGDCNHAPQGQPITSPSGRDVRVGGPPMVQFAALDRLVELRSGDVHHVKAQFVDAAVALVSNPKLVSSWQADLCDSPAAIAIPEEDLRVQKIGRTTGHTFGTIESKVRRVMALPYKGSSFTAVVNYADVWVIRSNDAEEPFALPGDSGSLIMDEEGTTAVALLFAASQDGQRAWAASLSSVIRELGGGFTMANGL
ncbi:MAG TPA: hypothetical protein VH062_10200 [Polyangiaceae bacterium]|jgi:hypothetical protein|nr:hypothetical protein [Polyangiaceae bacterium]